jgi:hypothetical protein
VSTDTVLDCVEPDCAVFGIVRLYAGEALHPVSAVIPSMLLPRTPENKPEPPKTGDENEKCLGSVHPWNHAATPAMAEACRQHTACA